MKVWQNFMNAIIDQFDEATKREQALADLEGRWDFSQEDLKKFEEEVKSNYGYPKYETCEAYIKKWMKGK